MTVSVLWLQGLFIFASHGFEVHFFPYARSLGTTLVCEDVDCSAFYDCGIKVPDHIHLVFLAICTLVGQATA